MPENKKYNNWLDNFDKGKQIPSTLSTAKPVIDLKFATTTEQKQLVAKNKRQRELDENPASYNVMKDYVGMGIKEPGLQTGIDPIDLVGTGIYKGLFKNGVKAIYPTMEKTLLKAGDIAGKVVTSKPVNQMVDKFNKVGKAEQKVKQGSDYIDNWYENPLINERYNNFRNKGITDSYKSDKAGDIINLIKGSNKPRYSEVLNNPKSDIKLTLDYEKLDRKPLSTKGIAYDYGDTYVNKLATNKASVAAHERTHQYFPGFTYNDAEIKALRAPFKFGNTKYERYLNKPQELHARINEARFQLGLKPEDKVTSEILKTLKTNTPGMKKMFNSVKDEKALINLFNNFYTPATIIGIGTKALEQDKKQNGGWLDNLK